MLVEAGGRGRRRLSRRVRSTRGFRGRFLLVGFAAGIWDPLLAGVCCYCEERGDDGSETGAG